ncbi:MAG: hypothetical protein PHN69_07375 [Candidatus Pacebacteria bacterium]|nr:hypothetical protein [Candidatus Paceibacterota bacterium]
MSRTWRFCNKKFSPLFSHPFKFLRQRCRCDCWCIDPMSSRHRRERSKTEIARELANLNVPEGTEIKMFGMRRFFSLK